MYINFFCRQSHIYIFIYAIFSLKEDYKQIIMLHLFCKMLFLLYLRFCTSFCR